MIRPDYAIEHLNYEHIRRCDCPTCTARKALLEYVAWLEARVAELEGGE